MNFGPIRTKRMREEILDQVVSHLKDGTYQPGDSLPCERDLSVSMKVSRASVAEALTMLEVLGVLVRKPGIGTFVVTDRSRILLFNPIGSLLIRTRKDVSDVFQLRRIVEMEAAGIAASEATTEDIAKIKQEHDKLVQLIAGEGVNEFSDAELHVVIARATHNELIASLVDGLWRMLVQVNAPLRQHMATHPNLQAPSIKTWDDIWEAISRGDSGEARRAMADHLELTESITLAMLNVRDLIK